MKLIDFLPREQHITIAISGLNKNAGKTVVLNKLIDDAVAIGKNVAITSIGYDGEKTDKLDGHQKPQISVTAGTIVATASSLIEKASLDVEIIEATKQYTPLGEVYIAKILQQGCIEIVGPSSLKGLIKLKEMMSELVDIFIIDGALNRVSQMSPMLCDTAIFAVGGQGTTSELVEKTRDQVSLFSIPVVPNILKEKAHNTLLSNKCALLSPSNELEIIQCSELINHKSKTNKYVLYHGALTYSVLKELQQVYQGVIVPDVSTIFVKPRLLKSTIKKGFSIYVGWKLPVSVVTLNPVNMAGQCLNVVDLGQSISSLMPNLPVVDVETSLYFKGGELVGRLE